MPRAITLDGNMMTSVSAAHRYLKDQFDFPGYYGGNLDALWDVLLDITDHTHVVLTSYDTAKRNLGAYAEALVLVFTDAAKQSPHIKFLIARWTDHC